MAFSNTASLISTSSAVVCFTLTAALLIAAPAEAAQKQDHITVYMHGAINVTDFVVLPGVAGLGHAALTAKAAPFGSMFVYNEPITTDPDPASENIGTMQGTGVTTSSNGTTSTFFVSSTATLNTTKYKGSFTQTGLSGGKIPIVGGTDDFQSVEGYTLSTYYSINGFNIVYKVDVYLLWK